MLSAYLVRIVHRANIHVAWPVYVHWYCAPIATLNQNKQSRKLYFGNAQIMSTCWIISKFSSVCLQTCSSTLPILRPTYNLWNKILIFLKLRHISNEDTLGSVPLVSIRLTENVAQYIRSINRELKQRRWWRQREWHKSNKATTLHDHHLYLLYISFPLLHSYDMKLPIFMFYVEHNLKKMIFIFFSKLINLDFQNTKWLAVGKRKEEIGSWKTFWVSQNMVSFSEPRIYQTLNLRSINL